VAEKLAAADYVWGTVVIGADLDAVRFAHNNRYVLIKNRLPHHHSYENIEEEWAEKLYELYAEGLCPFVDKTNKIRVLPENKLLKIYTDRNVYIVKYTDLHVYDDEGVEGFSLNRELMHYRVIDWFDCRGLHGFDFEQISTQDRFVNKIRFFKTLRIDGDQKYVDLLCESFLTEDQLKSFDYSDTMVRFKVIDVLKGRGIDNPRISLWKRDVYPIYKTI